MNLRVPPCDEGARNSALHRALNALSRCEETLVRWTWRDWLWPSPLAWGALAAIWVIVIVRESSTSSPRIESFASAPSLSRDPFFAHADYQELLRQFHQSPGTR